MIFQTLKPKHKPDMIASFLSRNPWIYVVLAFILLISAWSTLITVAVKFSPKQIEVMK
jgi:hypothetical protein